MVLVKVAQAPTNDFGKRIARISKKLMERYNFQEGELIELFSNKKRTAAFLYPLETDQEANELLLTSVTFEGLITMDGLLRASCSTSLDSVIRIDKTTYKLAHKIVLAPLSKSQIDLTNRKFTQLRNKPISAFDVVSISRMPMKNGASSTVVQADRDPQERTDRVLDDLNELRYVVTETEPHGILLITDKTEIVVETDAKITPMTSGAITYEDVGGYIKLKQKLHQFIEIPLKNPHFFQSTNIKFPDGLILTGPSGVGKSLLVKAVASETQVHVVQVDTSRIIGNDIAESERQLKRYFREAVVKAPSIIVVDDIDQLAPQRDATKIGNIARRITTQLIMEIDSLKSEAPIIVIATTKNPEDIDPSLRRPGRFDVELEMGPPDTNEREEILNVITRGVPLHADVDLREYAKRTRGFLAADISMLVKQAALERFQELLPLLDLSERIPRSVMQHFYIRKKNFDEALKTIEPSGMRKILAEIPDVTWDDIGGLANPIRELRESVEWQLQHPELFVEMGVKPSTGVLLYGPPGTGKTLLAKAVASQSGANFFPVRGPELTSMWFGETERAIREMFRRARQLAPAIIFFDEIESLMRARGINANESYMDRIINQFLTEIDGIDKKAQVLIIGATNRPELLDPAVLRPGRFDRLVYVNTPDESGRLKILQIHTSKMHLADDVDLVSIARKIEYYVGADIENICREAAMLSLRENINNRTVAMQHFEQAIAKTSPTMSEEYVKNYDALSQQLRGKIRNKYSKLQDTYL